MTDTNWMDRLSEYLDGTLTPEESAACEAWLASSAEGQELLQELRRVVARAKTLPDVAVPHAIWSAISQAIGKPDPKMRPIGAAQRLSASAPQRRQFTPLQLLAAAAIILAVGTGIGLTIRSGVEVQVAGTPPTAASGFQNVGMTPRADAIYNNAVQELQLILQQHRATMDTATVRVLESSLARIDAALAEAQRALDADPRSAYLNDHLSRIKRKKLDLLRQGASLVQAS